ncbi:MAG: glutamate synthase [Elusimicrobia bacterium]|nr:glutamate synthase [Elusimicrobiota bacterium]
MKLRNNDDSSPFPNLAISQSRNLSLINSRSRIEPAPPPLRKAESEGGCGVLGAISRFPIAGRHILAATENMKNRGNGKGGGICASWFADPAFFGTDQFVVDNDYLLAVALLNPKAISEIEEKAIKPFFDIHAQGALKHISNFRDIQGLTVEPPEIHYYFVRAKTLALTQFIEENKLEHISPNAIEDEFVYQRTYLFNKTYYHSLGDKQAFILSHAKNLIVIKLVGYAEDCIRYYQLENFQAHIWIGHQRYPTKGRVWHPGGAHPFIGMHEALVHNGDFANYVRVSKYLRQRKIYPLFLTDTEVSALLFDLWRRTYGYSLEMTIESLAPTTERDFFKLPDDKQKLYRQIQLASLKGSPDGPWFFIIARNDPDAHQGELIGITDTSMLRPQIFALSLAQGAPAIGAIASEKQAIDIFLENWRREDSSIGRYADLYWNARGASYSDGGAFIFRINKDRGAVTLHCENKFGQAVTIGPLKDFESPSNGEAPSYSSRPVSALTDLNDLAFLTSQIKKEPPSALGDWLPAMTSLINQRRDVQGFRRSRIIEMALDTLETLLDKISPETHCAPFVRLTFSRQDQLKPPPASEFSLIIDAQGFPIEGPRSLSSIIVRAYGLGWKKFLLYRTMGHRFIGCGLGPGSQDVEINVYGSPGDYLASGLDGGAIHVHNNAQDQVAQIMNSGTLVIYGDTGQTFMYGAKGGKVFVMGNTAGRPLINAVGKPRVVINGTALDYLAESFMAGDPLNGGGFVILNGITIGLDGKMHDLESPYPGGNLFSLASGGAIYARDPQRLLEEDQLNGGQFTDFTLKDWVLLESLLQENERLFGIKIKDLLSHQGAMLTPERVYRKIAPAKTRALALGYD